MISFARVRNLCLLIGCLFLVSACSTVVYKKEVDLFSQGVKNATETFETLRQESHAIDQQRLENGLKEKRAIIRVTDPCYNIVDELQKQSRCFGEWAEYYSAGEEQKPPDWCSEPKGFYELPIARAKECMIGPINNNQIDVKGLKARFMYEQVSAMAGKLSEYGAALSEIADSKDIDELKSAVGEAQTAITGAAKHYEDFTKSKLPGFDAIGPISELFTTIAVTVLEAKRFNVMKKIVNKADPIITLAAERLSISSMPLLLKTRIRPAQEKLQKASEEFNPQFLTAGNYSSRLKAINEAYTEYMQYFENDPSAVFEAMSKAHTALKDALNDPKTQSDNMQSSIKTFVAKAKAVHDVLKK